MSVAAAQLVRPEIDAPCAHRIDRVVMINDDAVVSGGAAGIVIASVRELRRRGVPVTLVSGEDRFDPMVVGIGADLVPLGGENILSGSRIAALHRGLYDPKIRDRVSTWIARNDTPGTVYHLHNWHKTLSPSVFHALEPVLDRLLHTAHDYFAVCPNGGFFNYRSSDQCDLKPMGMACLATNCDKRHYAHKLWRVARQATRHRTFRLSSGRTTVIAVHGGMIPLLQRGGIEHARVKVLRNPVTPWLRHRIEAERNRHVLYVGRIERDKGVDVMLAACRSAGVSAIVVGDGPMRAELMAQYPEAEFTGRMAAADIGRVAARARLLAMPTRWRETFGLVALEALSSGLPVAISTAPLISGEICRLGIGVAFPPDNIDALAAHLSALANDDEAIALMSASAMARSAELAPSVEAWGAALVDLYHQQLAQK